MSQLSMGGRWLHRSTGRVYTVVCNAIDHADFTRRVIAFDDDGAIWAFRADLFMDGRMKRLHDD